MSVWQLAPFFLEDKMSLTAIPPEKINHRTSDEIKTIIHLPGLPRPSVCDDGLVRATHRIWYFCEMDPEKNWEILKSWSWEIGKLGNWEIEKLGNCEIGKSQFPNFPISQVARLPSKPYHGAIASKFFRQIEESAGVVDRVESELGQSPPKNCKSDLDGQSWQELE